MHNIKDIVADIEGFKENLKKRGFDLSIVDECIGLNEKRKEATTKSETTQSEIKKISKEVGMKKRNGENADDLMAQVAELKKSIESTKAELEKVQEDLNYKLSTIPNLIAEDVPVGEDENDNVEVNKWGEPKKFSFEPKDHVDLGEKLQWLDFERAAKLTGARFVIQSGPLARLERAVSNFMIDHHLDKGYTEVVPPFIVNKDSLYGTGQLPKFSEDLFKLEGFDWYLIPTSEVPLTNIRAQEIFDQAELPMKFCGYTPCFRSEAGSHGRDTRGMIRMHQFQKVEMVNIVHPDESEKALEDMKRNAEEILEKLELPYRTVKLCTGDIGFGSRKTYDLEVWVPSQNTYREISSCSNCWDFQAQRASIRFKKQGEKPQFAHTLNGSGLAVGRTIVAILENYQNEDGSITVPKALVPYMGGLETITAKK
jgi:seryl-tRNA synthetase